MKKPTTRSGPAGASQRKESTRAGKRPAGPAASRTQQARAKGKGRKPTQAQVLVKLVEESYTTIIDQAGRPFAVPKEGPRIAVPLTGRGALSGQLTLLYFDRTSHVPTANAISSALSVIEAGAAARKNRQQIYLRVALVNGVLYVDLGSADGRCVEVRPGSWRLLKRPPEHVVFRRTSLTSEMPRPSRRSNLDLLRGLVNVTDEGWDLLRAWLVMALMPNIPVPILYLSGGQGNGKTTCARTVVSIVDPSPTPTQSPPGAKDDWPSVAAASRVVGIDNISVIPAWLSDVLCRAVTGEGTNKRKLYTDDDVHVTAFRRAIILTSIDAGSLRGDFGQRLIPIELDHMAKYRVEAELVELLAEAMPRILGGLFDLVAEVLANPAVPDELPRMADAGRIMASVDAALGSRSLAAYHAAQDNIAGIVVEGDPVADAVRKMLARRPDGVWTGIASELLDELRRWADSPRQWPGNGRSLGARLRRLQPALMEAWEIEVEFSRRKQRLIRLTQHGGREEEPQERKRGPKVVWP